MGYGYTPGVFLGKLVARPSSKQISPKGRYSGVLFSCAQNLRIIIQLMNALSIAREHCSSLSGTASLSNWSLSHSVPKTGRGHSRWHLLSGDQ